MHKAKWLLLSLLVALALCGCGQRGPLFLPDGAQDAPSDLDGQTDEDEDGSQARG